MRSSAGVLSFLSKAVDTAIIWDIEELYIVSSVLREFSLDEKTFPESFNHQAIRAFEMGIFFNYFY